MHTRRVIRGYVDFGDHNPPLLPRYVFLTDRADGTVWQLTHEQGAKDRISIDDSGIADGLLNYRLYPPYEGPFVRGDPILRLFVRGGRLGFEQISDPVNVVSRNQAPVMTRDVFNLVTFELIAPSTWPTDDVIAFEQFQF